jgi:hypothetical protein
MTPGQKLQLFSDLYHAARKLKTAAIRQQHPDWSEAEISGKVREIFLYART